MIRIYSMFCVQTVNKIIMNKRAAFGLPVVYVIKASHPLVLGSPYSRTIASASGGR